MNCPQCGRALAGGAKTCVYCGQGNTYKRRENLAIPKGTVPEHRKPVRWGRWLLLLLVVGGALAAAFYPPFHELLRGILEKAKGFV